MKIEHEEDYRNRRKAEYPPLAEQLGALWKGGAEAEAMREQIEAVKAKYPKPATEKNNVPV